ncbi:MAG: hydrogenase maturation nickel metallochaperone HypA [Mastigocoleus sp. MO_167.B18]|uniref:hydrogenase maturation nickel metallochaperone HypA n=1 Tax=Mastigocoleus sp. MO_188.B34 TaxID=3036635 RepID=UPI00263649F0|nr:hydrogenase maturation nickel metallochaperone HypA [Mastigocoleus sp. MO_188.B34]MDJ0695149.1 hydrogenase maturation nickel metallochaperone HypA [Mastigocoleus sp. MO_188.B34]MDJ0774693.1 hydrogenase maturation nickel metallochaperone HypA [Mastigocoleus sp. MO_167.B18]
MHELGITKNIVAIVTEYAQGKKVNRVLLEIGQLSAIMPESIQFCFDVVSQGTVLASATLEILEIPGLGHCCECGKEFTLEKYVFRCDCGSSKINIVTGEELKIKEIEVEELCV